MKSKTNMPSFNYIPWIIQVTTWHVRYIQDSTCLPCLLALLWNQITATAEAQMEQSAEQDDGRAIASMVGCFKNTCGMLSWYPNVSQCFHDLSGGMFSADSRAKTSLLVVPFRMSPVKRAEVHPSRLGCPSLFFSFRIPELAKDPWFCRCILDMIYVDSVDVYCQFKMREFDSSEGQLQHPFVSTERRQTWGWCSAASGTYHLPVPDWVRNGTLLTALPWEGCWWILSDGVWVLCVLSNYALLSWNAFWLALPTCVNSENLRLCELQLSGIAVPQGQAAHPWGAWACCIWNR